MWFRQIIDEKPAYQPHEASLLLLNEKNSWKLKKKLLYKQPRPTVVCNLVFPGWSLSFVLLCVSNRQFIFCMAASHYEQQMTTHRKKHLLHRLTGTKNNSVTLSRKFQYKSFSTSPTCISLKIIYKWSLGLHENFCLLKWSQESA